jgi:small subunit ribosomal protein S16
MLVIRLSRVGRKKLPMYRVMVQEKGRDPWGSHIEIIGHMNPHTNPSTITLKEDRAKHWLEQGAQPSDTVWNILVDKGLVKGEKRNKITISQKRQGKIDEVKAKEEEKKAAEAEAKKAEAEAAKATEEAKVVEAETKEESTGEVVAVEEEKKDE